MRELKTYTRKIIFSLFLVPRIPRQVLLHLATFIIKGKKEGNKEEAKKSGKMRNMRRETKMSLRSIFEPRTKSSAFFPRKLCRVEHLKEKQLPSQSTCLE
ncbi:hypothetical protein NPIL_119191 [Nephila pilipes]|uniref:Uncharacterized protein n=1 Tax=Nephila pilipes TaxID=299642 RepID=A0A8X6N1D3_NEPPI|nr:hypothetical protein NPIL_23581 [Nephila pilipes]GFU36471.1 hypothetical protein NPIL_119191 [Nephila pilipes]